MKAEVLSPRLGDADADAGARRGARAQCEAGDFALFYYPKEASVQYLYETFPQVVSPLVGVKNEHFAVWCALRRVARVARHGLPLRTLRALRAL